MSTETMEILKLCEALPAEKRAEVTDFARYLLDRADEKRWEEILSEDRPRPKLEAFACAAEAEASEELDPERL